MLKSKITITDIIEETKANKKKLSGALQISVDKFNEKVENKDFSSEETVKLESKLRSMFREFGEKRNRNYSRNKNGVTRIFNISSKKRPNDPLTINRKGKPVTKTVKEWIETEPSLIRFLVYEKKRYQLASNSLELLEPKKAKVVQLQIVATKPTITKDNDEKKLESNTIEWYPIIGFEGYYEINKSGEIRSINRSVKLSKGHRFYKQRYIQTRINNRGYVELRLSKDGLTKTKFIHILLAQTFIPNPDAKRYVNHINGNKTDNRIENLEWVTHSENIFHAYQTNLRSTESIQKSVFDLFTGLKHVSIKEAANFYGICYSTCKNYINGNRPNPTPLIRI